MTRSSFPPFLRPGLGAERSVLTVIIVVAAFAVFRLEVDILWIFPAGLNIRHSPCDRHMIDGIMTFLRQS
jgi:hypothetical protein